jgi:hypothetical protein
MHWDRASASGGACFVSFPHWLLLLLAPRWILLACCLLMGGRGACPRLPTIGNRAWHRSCTHCSSSRWPRAVSISLRSRRIARSGGIRASVRSLLSRAGKRRAHYARAPCSRHGSYISTRFFGRYFLWDSIVCLVHYEGMGFVVHGARWTSLGRVGSPG